MAVNVFVTPELLRGGLWLDPETGLHMAHVVFRNLHCVNMIRKALNLDYYTHLRDPILQAHIEHCIDAIRLSVMCNGDMTLIPIRWSENRNWILPVFETVHTCRDYDSLRSWSIDRDVADPELLYANAERLRKNEHVSWP
ncbi:hypothetical protein LX36DRAFT_590763 [Colletotrichum falcatum]|nr:hypothetical protein LX36DRAFT_590763 [Colletotrichum falcatum]